MPEATRPHARLATALLAAHVALIAFSTLALTTILARPDHPLRLTPFAAQVMPIAWKYSGMTYVVLGALAALAHLTGRIGARRAAALFAISSGIALGSELLGTSTGYPFGGYSYTPLLGWRIAGLVPFPIPVSWFYMLYGALAICARLLPARDDRATLWRWSLVAGLVLTAWDVSMDPAMVKTAHWVWHEPGAFYGMPLSNFAGWILTGTVIARVMLAIVPPTAMAAALRDARLPLVLYAVNGVMPVAICLRDGLWWAAGLGTLAMVIPLTLALGFRPWALGQVGWTIGRGPRAEGR